MESEKEMKQLIRELYDTFILSNIHIYMTVNYSYLEINRWRQCVAPRHFECSRSRRKWYRLLHSKGIARCCQETEEKTRSCHHFACLVERETV